MVEYNGATTRDYSLDRMPQTRPELGELLFINVSDYGAVGDGIADDTVALQNWLNAGGFYLFKDTYRITAGLTLTGDNRQLIMNNATIVADADNITVLTVPSNNCYISVNINGNNKANYGIKITGAGTTIENSRVENLYSSTLTARAIEVTSTSGCVIKNNVIRNVNSVGNVTLGDNNGAARAILLNAATAATVSSFILNNVIDNIIGEEGDAIQVLFTDYASAKTVIQGNVISNCSRRFIKIQAADCEILDNTLTHDGVVPTYPANCIDLISASNCVVQGNFIGPHPLLVSISVTGTVGTPSTNIVVRNNTIRQDDAKNIVDIYWSYVDESIIDGNIIYGGSYGASIGNCVGVLISNNTMFGGIVANPAFNANGSNTGIVTKNNVNMAAGRATTVTNASTSGLSEYNAKRP